nr:NSP1 [Rotavirus F]
MASLLVKLYYVLRLLGVTYSHQVVGNKFLKRHLKTTLGIVPTDEWRETPCMQQSLVTGCCLSCGRVKSLFSCILCHVPHICHNCLSLNLLICPFVPMKHRFEITAVYKKKEDTTTFTITDLKLLIGKWFDLLSIGEKRLEKIQRLRKQRLHYGFGNAIDLNSFLIPYTVMKIETRNYVIYDLAYYDTVKSQNTSYSLINLDKLIGARQLISQNNFELIQQRKFMGMSVVPATFTLNLVVERETWPVENDYPVYSQSYHYSKRVIVPLLASGKCAFVKRQIDAGMRGLFEPVLPYRNQYILRLFVEQMVYEHRLKLNLVRYLPRYALEFKRQFGLINEYLSTLQIAEPISVAEALIHYCTHRHFNIQDCISCIASNEVVSQFRDWKVRRCNELNHIQWVQNRKCSCDEVCNCMFQQIVSDEYTEYVSHDHSICEEQDILRQCSRLSYAFTDHESITNQSPLIDLTAADRISNSLDTNDFVAYRLPIPSEFQSPEEYMEYVVLKFPQLPVSVLNLIACECERIHNCVISLTEGAIKVIDDDGVSVIPMF